MSLVDDRVANEQQEIRGGRFVTGGKPGPGRPRGSRNKLAEAFVADLFDDWQQRGPSVIERCAIEKPAEYLKIVAGLLPKDVNITTRSLDDLTDDQMMRKLAKLTEMARPLLAKLPAMIDVTPAGTDARADVAPVMDITDKSST